MHMADNTFCGIVNKATLHIALLLYTNNKIHVDSCISRIVYS